jgi:hypothetical protein
MFPMTNGKSVLAMAAIAAATLGALGNPASAASNDPPPAGNVIYELTGQAITNVFQTAAVNFTAAANSTNLSFAFREDPAFLLLDNVSLVDVTTGSGNLLTNGDFELGPVGANAPFGWTYLNTFGASFAGVVAAGCGPDGSNCYDDGAVQAYDAITQNVLTNTGDLYLLTFDYADTSPGGVYQPLSTNGDVTDTGGNGRDLFVYAGAIPVRAPEPASLTLLGGALVGLGLFRRRKRS